MKRICCVLLAMALLLPGIALAERLPDEKLVGYYDNGLFAGDSIMSMLRTYILKQRKEDPAFFRDAVFYTAASYQLFTAAMEHHYPERVNLMYNGAEHTLYEIAETLKKPKLFLLAGRNDKIADHPDRGMRYMERIVRNMQERAPETQVHFFSITPVTAAKDKNGKEQAAIDAYNELMKAKCEELGVGFIDISTALKGEDGHMPAEYSSDQEYHLGNKGNDIWIRCMLDFAQQEYEAGSWTPAAE